MAVSSGRSKIDYEKLKEQDEIEKHRNEWNSWIKDCLTDFDQSSGIGVVGVPTSLTIDSEPYNHHRDFAEDAYFRPSRTVRSECVIDYFQLAGFNQNHRDQIIQDAKDRLVQQLSEMFSRQAVVNTEMMYDGSIRLTAEIDLDGIH